MSEVRLCLFELLGSPCAIDLNRVVAVVPRGERTPLPDGPEWAKEAVLYEGQALPLVDLDRVRPHPTLTPKHASRAKAQSPAESVAESGPGPSGYLGAGPPDKDVIVRLGRGALALPVDSVPRTERVKLGQLCSGYPSSGSPWVSMSGTFALGWVKGMNPVPMLLDVHGLFGPK